MAFLTQILVASCIAAIAGTASAQIVPTAQFTGQQSDGFETQTSGAATTCVLGRMFNNTADLCDPTGNAMIVTSGWSFVCSINPNSGGRLCASAGGPAVFTFDQPVVRFGGYFGTNCGVPDATADFFDASGALLASLTVTIPANCTWTWSGWTVVSGPSIKSIKFTSLNTFGGGFVDMDDLEVDYGTPCPVPMTYCTPKLNSLGCTPTITATGTASATAPNGLMIRGANVRNNKAGFLLYGVTGRAATPFCGGFLCILPPVKRTPSGSSGGTPAPASDCSGIYSIDMNSMAQGLLGGGLPLPALTVPGTVVDCQFWGLDPGFAAPNHVTLTEGLEYVVCP